MGKYCPDCNKWFASDWGLEMHTRRTTGCGKRPRRSVEVPRPNVDGGGSKYRSAGAFQNLERLFKRPRLDSPAAGSSAIGARRTRQHDNIILELEEVGDVHCPPLVRPDLSEPRPAPSANRLEAADLCLELQKQIIAVSDKAGKVKTDKLLQLVTSPRLECFLNSRELRADSFSSVGNARAGIEARLFSGFGDMDGHCSNLRFEERLVWEDEIGVGAPLKLQMRSPVAVLKRMLETTREGRNFYFHPIRQVNRRKERVVAHPMSGDVAHAAAAEIKDTIQSCVSKDPTDGSAVYWSENSFVAPVQMYSDKSCMSMKSDGFTFYPVHVCLLGFTLSVRDAAIRQGDTCVGFLPVESEWPASARDGKAKFREDGEPIATTNHVHLSHIDHSSKLRSSTGGKSVHHGRAAKGRSRRNGAVTSDSTGTRGRGPLPTVQTNRGIMAKSLEIMLHDLKDIAMSGITFTDADGISRKAHIALASYVADTPEVSLVCCTRSNRCHRCDIPVEEMGTPGAIGAPRSASTTDETLFVQSLFNDSQRAQRDKDNKQPADARNAQQAVCRRVEEAIRDSARTAAAKSRLLELAKNFASYASQCGLADKRPYTLGWPFASTHMSLDPYRIFRVELMHNMPLGLLKTLLSLVPRRLGSKRMTTSRFTDSKGRPKKLHSMRTAFLHAANKFIGHIAREAPAVDFKIDHAKKRSSKNLDGLFIAGSPPTIASMLEAKDMINIQQVMPFVAAVLDKLCATDPSESPHSDTDDDAAFKFGTESVSQPAQVEQVSTLEAMAPFTAIFVGYNDLYRRLSGKDRDEVGFTSSDLEELSQVIAKFKALAVNVFIAFQKTKFCYPKFHALEHFVQDIRDLGCPAFYAADPYEASHVVFKAMNRATSRRRTTTQVETTEKLSLAHGLRNLLASRPIEGDATGGRTAGDARRGLTTSGAAENPAAAGGPGPEQSAVLSDACCLVGRRGTGVPFAELDQAVKDALQADHSPDRHRWQCQPRSADPEDATKGAGREHHDDVLPDGHKKTIGSESLTRGILFVAALGGATLAAKALTILRKKALPDRWDMGLNRAQFVLNSLRFHIVKSAYVAGFPAPSLDNEIDRRDGSASVALVNDGSRIRQKIVAALRYSHSANARQDSVMVQGEENSDSDSESGSEPPISGTESVLTRSAAAKCSGKLNVWFARVLLFMHVSCDEGPYEKGEEVAVVRYYSVEQRCGESNPGSAVSTEDAVDKVLGCIKLSWAQDSHNDPWIDVIPASSIRGRVHVVPADLPTGCGSLMRAVAWSNDKDAEPGDCADDDEILDDASDSELESDGVAIFADSDDWQHRKFHVNRFKFINRGEFLYNVVDLPSGTRSVLPSQLC